MSLESLDHLYAEQLQDLRSAESQLVKALPQVIEAVHSAELREIIEAHLGETRRHLERINEALADLDHPGSQGTCEAMEGLIKEADEILGGDGNPDVKDAAIIAAAQRVEHYEISAYGTAIAFAKKLGLDKAAGLLARTLEEEKAADMKLTDIAEDSVNEMALEAGEEAETAERRE
jgi:ferritin-like metal-binding protein YciE